MDAARRARLVEDYGMLPLSFEANQGQAERRVKFLSRGSGYTLLLTGDEAVLALRSRQSPVVSGLLQKTITTDHGLQTTDGLRLKLVGANRSPLVTGFDELPGKSNYFIGSDPAKWQTDVRTYAKVGYKSVYPGVDLVYYGNQRQLEYDFVIAPGADPEAIALEIETGKSKSETRKSKMRVDAGGDLVIEAEGGEVRFQKPVVYQPRGSLNLEFTIHNSELLNGRYVLAADNRVRFEVATYDPTEPLIIDPVMVYSTYIGGVGFDGGNGIAVDSSGNAFVTGRTASFDFPLAKSFQAANHGSPGEGTAFVTKLNAAGNALVYSTYLGGTFFEQGLGIAVDHHGRAYVTGSTGSPDFPTTPDAFQRTSGGRNDAFVTKLNARGNALIYSTYLGGSDDDSGTGIAVDGRGDAYVTGYTCSIDFPTARPLQGANGSGGCYDAFAARLNHNGSALIYSTYLGGSGWDFGNGIAIDRHGNAYVTGWTRSTDFPTANPIQGTSGDAAVGEGDAFVSKLDARGNALVYSTYLGGSLEDVGSSIAVDSSGSAYVTGFTNSANFPTANPLQGTLNGFENAFLAKVNAAGSAFVYSTYVGFAQRGRGIAVDFSGNAYVTGTGDASCGHVGVAELNAPGNGFLYSISFGGNDVDQVTGIAVDSSGNAYVTGFTFSGDFPTVNPIQTGHGGEPDSDAFVTKIGPLVPQENLDLPKSPRGR